MIISLSTYPLLVVVSQSGPDLVIGSLYLVIGSNIEQAFRMFGGPFESLVVGSKV